MSKKCGGCRKPQKVTVSTAHGSVELKVCSVCDAPKCPFCKKPSQKPYAHSVNKCQHCGTALPWLPKQS